jgi:hypothetical protein
MLALRSREREQFAIEEWTQADSCSSSSYLQHQPHHNIHPVTDTPLAVFLTTMNPATPENPAGATTISPSYSPLHPPSVQHNSLILTNLCTLTSVFSGTLAGILGLLFNAAVIAVLKCRNEKTGKIDLERFLPSLHDVNSSSSSSSSKSTKGLDLKLTGRALWSLMAVGQENLLTFLLFWIGFYVSARPVSSLLSFPEVIKVYRSCTLMSDSSFVVFCVGCCEQAIIHGSSLLLTYQKAFLNLPTY